ncbi:MAG: hypothetical protein ACUZ8H_02225 [Candidatus Anammoxibacter sp.]
MPLTNAQKQAALRSRRASQGLKELRGIWATEAQEPIIKKAVIKIIKRLSINDKRVD